MTADFMLTNFRHYKNETLLYKGEQSSEEG